MATTSSGKLMRVDNHEYSGTRTRRTHEPEPKWTMSQSKQEGAIKVKNHDKCLKVDLPQDSLLAKSCEGITQHYQFFFRLRNISGSNYKQLEHCVFDQQHNSCMWDDNCLGVKGTLQVGAIAAIHSCKQDTEKMR